MYLTCPVLSCNTSGIIQKNSRSDDTAVVVLSPEGPDGDARVKPRNVTTLPFPLSSYTDGVVERAIGFKGKVTKFSLCFGKEIPAISI